MSVWTRSSWTVKLALGQTIWERVLGKDGHLGNLRNQMVFKARRL